MQQTKVKEMTNAVYLCEGEAVEPSVLNSLQGVEWVRRQDVLDHFAVGKDVLDRWVTEDKVEAHKLHPGKNGTVIFSVEDIRNAIRSSPRYRPLASA